MARAAHQIFDDPRILEDPIALKIIGKQNLSEISSAPDQYKTRFATYLRAFLVARSRYAEDALSEATQRGVGQYVILGAGLDTFSYRNPSSPEKRRIFEVDHPSTQAWKQELLDKESIGVPECLTFVSIDFEKETLANPLLKAGFKSDESSFFSWLGVTMYLSADAVMATIKSIASLATRGSEIVFDYSLPASTLSPESVLRHQTLAARVAAVGEPWQSAFDPKVLATELKAMGFTPIEDLGPDEISARYFQNRTDGLRVAGRTHLMRAQVL
jgi:methyltransferase (TIGR00027 family)